MNQNSDCAQPSGAYGRTETRRNTPQLSLFDEVASNVPGVCENCYSRLQEVIDLRGQKEQMGHKRRQQVPDRVFEPVYGQTSVEYLPTADGPSVPHRACNDCGAIDPINQRPVSVDRLLDYADNVADRLQEKGIPFSRSTLRSHVTELKQSDLQTEDNEILRVSVEKATEITYVEYKRQREDDGDYGETVDLEMDREVHERNEEYANSVRNQSSDSPDQSSDPAATTDTR